jgi:hypothetical protein
MVGCSSYPQHFKGILVILMLPLPIIENLTIVAFGSMSVRSWVG